MVIFHLIIGTDRHCCYIVSSVCPWRSTGWVVVRSSRTTTPPLAV